MKKIRCLSVALVLLLFCSGCNGETTYEKHQIEYLDLFDTVTIVIVYSKTEEEFKTYANMIHNEMLRIHRLCDIYNTYEDISNLKTVNDNAGIEAVQVDQTIIDLLNLAGASYDGSFGSVNVAMGSVLRIWHEYMQKGTEHPESAQLPIQQELEAACKHIDYANVEIDDASNTVYLADSQMSLDVGALAKGYAVQCAVDVAQDAGMVSGSVSAGGNVCVLGTPMDGRAAWVIGIQNPDTSHGAQPLFDIVKVADTALVTSGNYQRYYEVDGVVYPHIINPETLYPATRYQSVTIVINDSGIADMLSTALFILPYEQGLELAGAYGAEVLWILHDGSVCMTEGYKTISEEFNQS